MKVLYICSELYPFLKTGGLADVSAGLPPALHALGCDVRLLLPAFPAFTENVQATRAVAQTPLRLGEKHHSFQLQRSRWEHCPVSNALPTCLMPRSCSLALEIPTLGPMARTGVTTHNALLRWDGQAPV